MANNNIVIDLKANKDQFGRTYHVGKIEAPCLIDLSKGVCFLIYTSEIGSEQLQIALMHKKEKED